MKYLILEGKQQNMSMTPHLKKEKKKRTKQKYQKSFSPRHYWSNEMIFPIHDVLNTLCLVDVFYFVPFLILYFEEAYFFYSLISSLQGATGGIYLLKASCKSICFSTNNILKFSAAMTVCVDSFLFLEVCHTCLLLFCEYHSLELCSNSIFSGLQMIQDSFINIGLYMFTIEFVWCPQRLEEMCYAFSMFLKKSTVDSTLKWTLSSMNVACQWCCSG